MSTETRGQPATQAAGRRPRTTRQSVTIRFCGDSGDGMQLAGTQFTDTSAIVGNDISTLPDFPAEIRAPAGSIAGVSGFQIHFSADDIFTPGDELDALVAMNPAALRVNVRSVRDGGLVIVNEDAFAGTDLRKAGYDVSPLADGSLSRWRVVPIPISKLTMDAVKSSGLGSRDAARCRNMLALGLVYWLYDRPLEPTLQFIADKFGRKPAVADANRQALLAGYHFGETTELFPQQYSVPPAHLPPGRYRKVTGNEAAALGLVAAAERAGKQLVYCSYPITPASDILHELSLHKAHGVVTFQAEDEIAAVGAAIGASFGGAVGVTGTSGPGLALKAEAIGLAVMTELPLVVINVQRGGPSTGLPTKTEQADLLQAVQGRNGECPVVVLAAASPADCFAAAVEATTLALRYMTPVLLLTDGYIANGAEPWKIADLASMPRIEVRHPPSPQNGEPFHPYRRDADLVRPWALPGTPGLEHRIGGLEKEDVTGNVSYDPMNHETMVRLRAAKVDGVKPAGPALLWTGEESGDVLVVGWGGTYGAIRAAVNELRQEGVRASAAHLRYLHPLPADLGERMARFRHVLVPELNLGQLRQLLRARYLVDAVGLNKVRGQPFTITEIERAVRDVLLGRAPQIESSHAAAEPSAGG